MPNKQEKTKEERIYEEYEGLLKSYVGIAENKKALVFAQLQNLAFMKVTLEDLQKIINEEGCGEIYKNGNNQSGRKATAEVSAYNAMIKNYYGLAEKMDKYLPADSKPTSKLGEFMSK